MRMIKTPLEGLWLIEPVIHQDERGYFLETYHHKKFSIERAVTFVQDNESLSLRGVLRGLHYQDGEHAQAKLVRVVRGEIFVAVVDLRVHSATYLQHFTHRLDGVTHQQLFVPKGFAHGFLTLSAEAIVHYKCDQFYHPASERGVRWNDPALKISWPLDKSEIKLAPRDAQWPLLVTT